MKSIRLAKLNKFNKKTFRRDELQLLWKVNNNSSLSTILNRYIKSKVLFRIYRGLYSIVDPIYLNKYELACAVGGAFSYISNETILSNSSIIMQQPRAITVVGMKNRDYKIGDFDIKIRAMAKQFLHNTLGILDMVSYRMADKERAVADMLHFDKKYHFDNLNSISKNRVNNYIKAIYNDNISIK